MTKGESKTEGWMTELTRYLPTYEKGAGVPISATITRAYFE